MIGAIIGDIVGSVYEFDNIKTKDFVPFAGYHGNTCTFTDDSVMTLAVALALLGVDGKWDLLPAYTDCAMHELGRRYPDRGYGERFGMWLFLDGHEPYNSFGNGAAMRVSPVAYVAKDLDEVKLLSRLVTGVTHNHPEGLKGAEANAVCTWMALHGSSKTEIEQVVSSEYYDLGFTLDEIRPTYEFNETCQETVPQAIKAFLEAADFEDAIKNAVSLGGDSDTLAAITGAIAGAYYEIPSIMRQRTVQLLGPSLTAILERFDSKYCKQMKE